MRKGLGDESKDMKRKMPASKVLEMGTSLEHWKNTKKASVAGLLPENTENRKMRKETR